MNLPINLKVILVQKYIGRKIYYKSRPKIRYQLICMALEHFKQDKAGIYGSYKNYQRAYDIEYRQRPYVKIMRKERLEEYTKIPRVREKMRRICAKRYSDYKSWRTEREEKGMPYASYFNWCNKKKRVEIEKLGYAYPCERKEKCRLAKEGSFAFSTYENPPLQGRRMARQILFQKKSKRR